MNKYYHFILVAGIIFISCNHNRKFSSPKYNYSVEAPGNWRAMTDKEKNQDNIPMWVSADIALINEKDCIIKNAGLMKDRTDTVPMYALCHFSTSSKCSAYDNNIASLSQEREIRKWEDKNDPTFLGSLISGDCYVENRKMIVYMEHDPFDRFVADIFLNEGTLSISVYAYYAVSVKLQTRMLEDFMYMVKSLRLKPQQYCS